MRNHQTEGIGKNLPWTPEHGWRDLHFGKSTIYDVIAVLGQPEHSEKLFDGEIYSFCNDTVHATYLKEQPGLFSIRIDAKYDGPDSMPEDLESAKRVFCHLQPLDDEAHLYQIYEGEGVRLTCDPFDESPQILCVELEPQHA
jgi:hypothetical protein